MARVTSTLQEFAFWQPVVSPRCQLIQIIQPPMQFAPLSDPNFSSSFFSKNQNRHIHPYQRWRELLAAFQHQNLTPHRSLRSNLHHNFADYGSRYTRFIT
ncbi:unnamed protein product [Cuscuta europaea]|uniref:Uncharacterized protein n=1 Tax=Cuscuta europaea TaxID=41803 RepID=A0A9P0YQH6_CUSEU|nr:unnamed protein product [Cuscuta europaea]